MPKPCPVPNMPNYVTGGAVPPIDTGDLVVSSAGVLRGAVAWSEDCDQCHRLGDECPRHGSVVPVVGVLGTIEVCDDCMIVNVNGEVSPDRPADAPPVWGRYPGIDAVHDCDDCKSGDSHAFVRVDCDACGDSVNTVHEMAVFRW